MEGHEKLAHLMATHPETAIFQRFKFLNRLNLLYLQAELVEQETDLKACLKNDRESVDDNRKRCSSDWFFLSNIEESGTWKMMLKTRGLLREYNQALHLQMQLQQFDSPRPEHLKFLNEWFLNTKMGNRPLTGQDEDLWKDSEPADLWTIKPCKGQDPLTIWFLRRVLDWWHYSIGYRLKKRRDLEAQYADYDDNHFERLANIAASIISSGLLVGSIVGLYFIQSTAVQLAMIAVFTQIFSLVLVLLTGARKVDVFAATAAFVAVQVVFIGSTSGGVSRNG